MKKYRTDYPLWGLVAGSLFLALAAITLLAKEDWTPEARAKVPVNLLNLAFWCAVFGWVFHAVAVVCGVHISRPGDQQPLADYDDQPPALPED
jgi:hypothetical protein